MAEPNISVRLNSEEGRIKAESLFTKKFRDYLTTKKTLISHGFSYSHIKSHSKEYSGSSSETASESSKKSGKKFRKKLKEKKPYWNVQYTLRNRLVQCSLLQSEAEVVPPDDLKPLLNNITLLQQDLKQVPPELENLCNLIAKITLLLAQFARRPFQKIPESDKGEHMKNAEKTAQMIVTLLDEYKSEVSLDPDNSVREYKRIEKEITNKEREINEVKIKLNNKTGNINLKVKDLETLLRNSALANENLKFDIKFNQNRLKKYKKAVMEREWIKHKLENELAHLKKKISKADLSDNDSLDKQSGCSEPNLKKELFSRSHLKSTKVKKLKRNIK